MVNLSIDFIALLQGFLLVYVGFVWGHGFCMWEEVEDTPISKIFGFITLPLTVPLVILVDGVKRLFGRGGQ